MKKPHAVIYVAETSCCGLRVHDPAQLGSPAHTRIGGPGYESCKIVRYWKFRASRAMSRREVDVRRQT